jgi:predicted nucleic acid-binding protein
MVEAGSPREETRRIIDRAADLFRILAADEENAPVMAAIQGELYALLAHNAELRAEVERLRAENARLAGELTDTAEELALSVTTVEHLSAYLERSSRWRAPPPGTYAACTECGRCGRGGGEPCACEGAEGVLGRDC